MCMLLPNAYCVCVHSGEVFTRQVICTHTYMQGGARLAQALRASLAQALRHTPTHAAPHRLDEELGARDQHLVLAVANAPETNDKDKTMLLDCVRCMDFAIQQAKEHNWTGTLEALLSEKAAVREQFKTARIPTSIGSKLAHAKSAVAKSTGVVWSFLADKFASVDSQERPCSSSACWTHRLSR